MELNCHWQTRISCIRCSSAHRPPSRRATRSYSFFQRSTQLLADRYPKTGTHARIHPATHARALRTTYRGGMSNEQIPLRILKSPWSQAAVGGALTLIPGRRYPAWLRHAITWGSTATVTVLVANPRLGPRVLGALSRSSDQEPPEPIETSPKARAVSAAVTGAATFGMLRLGWWFDEAAEQALRKLQVPFPRVLLGVAVGAFYYATDDRERKDKNSLHD